MNTATFAGHLGRDAELRATPSGKQVLNFSLAVNIGRGGEKKTLWVGCALWGERGEKLAQYLVKGKVIAVSGEIDLRQYETRDGKHGAELTCNVQQLTLLGGEAKAKDQKPVAPAAQQVPPPADSPDDEIPFAFLLAPLAGMLVAAASMTGYVA